MVQFIKDFLWGTFNYRNKGMPMWGYVTTGYHFAKISQTRRNYERYFDK